MYPVENNVGNPKRKTPLALRFGMEAVVALSKPIKSVSVEGESNLSEIPRDTPVIIAVSHGSDYDIPLSVKVLAEHLDIAITDQSTHHSFSGEPGMFLSLNLAGKDNFIPITYSWDGGQKFPGMFEPSDSIPMVEALQKGKNVLVAVHKPLKADGSGQVEQAKPGYSAAYLAAITEAPVLPVNVSLLPTDKVDKFDAIVTIGKPFLIEDQQKIIVLQRLSEKRQSGEKLSSLEVAELTSGLKELRVAGQTVFDEVSRLKVFTDTYPVQPAKKKMAQSAMWAGHSFRGSLR
jgi:hypothetical protein